MIDNPDTWLPFTDLVFIDPVGTGYSQAAASGDAAAKQFWGVRQDLDALADIIRLHATRADRVAAPVYLVGESYGGFRAARLARALAQREGIAGRRGDDLAGHRVPADAAATARCAVLGLAGCRPTPRRRWPQAGADRPDALARRSASRWATTSPALAAGRRRDRRRTLYASRGRAHRARRGAGRALSSGRVPPRRLCQGVAARRRADRQPL